MGLSSGYLGTRRVPLKVSSVFSFEKESWQGFRKPLLLLEFSVLSSSQLSIFPLCLKVLRFLIFIGAWHVQVGLLGDGFVQVMARLCRLWAIEAGEAYGHASGVEERTFMHAQARGGGMGCVGCAGHREEKMVSGGKGVSVWLFSACDMEKGEGT